MPPLYPPIFPMSISIFSQFSSSFSQWQHSWNIFFPAFLGHWILKHPAHFCHNYIFKASFILRNSLSHEPSTAPSCLLKINLFMIESPLHKQPHFVFPVLFCRPVFSWMFQTFLLSFMLILYPTNFSSLPESSPLFS